MTAGPGLVKDLQKRVTLLEADLRRQSDDPTNAWGASLRQEHQRATSRGRTGLSWSEWREGEVSQAAVSWVLATVFIRFCEDNGLLDGVWIAGPGDRLAQAVDAETAFYTEVPSRTATDWLREAFGVLASLPAGRGLVDPRHNPVWSAPIGPDAARELVSFWRLQDGAGVLERDFTDPALDTRFLGDLYQDMSESARKKYALLQTPVFVEEFILDRTLTPALEEFGLEGLKLIDPTCGSGHFLLGALDRLLDAWAVHAPGLTPEARVQKALDSVHGVDLNPFAVAISRFRLTLAALRASGAASLAKVPAFAYHVAVGDSLLAGTAGRQGELFAAGDDGESLGSFEYASEDVSEYPGILDPGRYQVVVGNPPYITVKDKVLNQAYREIYSTCSGKYALSVPFMERFFQLASRGDGQQPAGFVGQITANSFMKREFGKKLIEEFLAGGTFAIPVDLQTVIDTSGAYIPGHGTPTVILIGRTRPPLGDTVRAVLGVRGEPGRPDEPSRGLVWSQVVTTVDLPGSNGEYVTVTELPRKALASFPWSLGGGEAMAVMSTIDAMHCERLGSRCGRIGFFGITGFDELALAAPGAFDRWRVESSLHRVHVAGDEVRDWSIAPSEDVFFPYAPSLIDEVAANRSVFLWPHRTHLAARKTFSGATYAVEGRPWWGWHQLPDDSRFAPWAITWSQVQTHNHFALARDEFAFNSKAMILRLPAGAETDDFLEVLGGLNSSTACFWLKQVSHDKGNGGYGGGIADQEWERFFEFTGAKLQEFPLPRDFPRDRARELDSLAVELQDATPTRLIVDRGVSREVLDKGRQLWLRVRARMVFEQEELDWEVYRSYGLLDEDLVYRGSGVDTVELGQRAFEILLARRVARGLEETAWFERHGSTPITEPPIEWPQDYRDVYFKRHEVMQNNAFIALLERPEYKRRWASRSWEELEREALVEFVLDRLEAPERWAEGGAPAVVSVGRLADQVRPDQDVVEALRLLTGHEDLDVSVELEKLLRDECVPFLGSHRYTDSGRGKRAEWEQVWALQRREDAGEKVTIPVPPKYTNKDFRRASYWSARGKLDVPKERFISYPGAERGGDKTLVLGWAGWNHLEQARALATLITEGIQEDGWDTERLTPLLAGLAELEPWLHQWHDDPDPLFGGSPAEFMTTFLEGQLDALSLTREALASWRPPPTGKAAKAAAKAAAETTDQELDL